ncbi:tRNA (adenine(58)-N(1))-methyltransferase catalytic subunit TRM61 [Mycena indigotica]|uniref:tRNA (adenine(58)-N(1))-methyltransferase catalytic subunit TRM61 n=1 Tax=Mycena indigotica TaxID=2126181 RepID=A0A8H6SFQ9_9AGAR|nr:tRNA (adenine(58)-N(1))-methyltransferase catalytic subunit TRM61 [Mycena indigotica]KAF7298686.1 tRNA (adenine(58)-N(1))-methyltransferase catalytic subunit TRM61 [Mycena indigotica]
MWSTARDIADGDTVIIWLTRDLVQPLLVTAGKEFNSKFGTYRHSDFIGLAFGSKVGSRTGKGFIHVLRPTPELWTLALPHRTQILYIADISLIVSYLDIRAGSKVIEAGPCASVESSSFPTTTKHRVGTGSGSFSHSVARTIGPSGRLWSYEFHEARAKKASDEFSRHGLAEIITLTHQNVCKDGFNVTDEADSVFLDLPAPWDAVPHAKQALRKDRTTRICCFSPCMEQVLRTVSALNETGFSDITMYETLVRLQDVSQIPAPPPVSEITEKLKKVEAVREDKRQRQIAAGQRSHEPHGEKRKRTEDLTDEEPTPPEDPNSGKRLKVAAVEVDMSPTPTMSVTPKVSLSKVVPEVRGHTSYLTFATLFPSLPTNASNIQIDS